MKRYLYKGDQNKMQFYSEGLLGSWALLVPKFCYFFIYLLSSQPALDSQLVSR